MSVSSRDTVASRNALRNALRNTIRDARVTTSTTPDRAQPREGPKPDSLRSTRVGAIWKALAPPDEGALCSAAREITLADARESSQVGPLT
jgi:hypothetical protein